MGEGIGLAATTEPAVGYQRERLLQVQRQQYRWQHLAGLPACSDGIPEPERWSRFQTESFDYDVGVSLANAAISAIGWTLDKRSAAKLSHYDWLYTLRRRPATADRWRDDEEFARQRLDGINPLQIARCDVVPERFAVTDGRVASVIGDRTISSLADAGRLYLCDWAELEGVPVNLGRFLTAPMALFWVDDRGILMPLAIQLGQSVDTAPVVFTPADERWLWLTARTHVQAADAAYHEIIAHLFRTHFAMETIWMATNRGLPAQHPVYEFLAPHFAGTIEINVKARTDLIAPGGPIDDAISVGTDGSYWLINQALQTFTFGDLDPRRDMERRGVTDPDLLPGYHYRDDALPLWDVIGTFVDEVLRMFYPDDATVAADEELAAWAHELADPECGGIKGLPLVDGRFATFADLHHVIRQAVFTASCEHSAVNNGQYDIFGYIPNSPGSVYLPPPTTLDPSCEGEFVYALPPLKSCDVQMTLVHLLSRPPQSRLGHYPTEFFRAEHEVHAAIDRFRDALDQIAIEVEARNRGLAVPYTYLDPVQIAVSINV